MANKKNAENSTKLDEKIMTIRRDLQDQLLEQGKIGKHFDDLVEDYICLLKLKESLKEDIDKKGLRYRVKTGNGFYNNKPNESVTNILKVNAQMLKILDELNLKAPSQTPKDGEENDLL